jgi:spermidine synthase
MGQLFFHEKHPDGFIAREVTEVIYYGKTKVQSAAIVRLLNLGRTLFLDGCFQSDDVFREEYHRRMAVLAEGLQEYPAIAIAGGGPGGLAAALFRMYPNARILELDIDPELREICNRYLPDWGEDPDRKNYEKVTGNAFTYQWPSGAKFDAFFWDIDADTLDGEYSKEIFAEIGKLIRPGGVFIATAGTILALPQNSNYSTMRDALVKAYPQGQFHPWLEMFWNFFSAKVP